MKLAATRKPFFVSNSEKGTGAIITINIKTTDSCMEMVYTCSMDSVFDIRHAIVATEAADQQQQQQQQQVSRWFE